MRQKKCERLLFRTLVMGCSFTLASMGYAATPVDLSHQSLPALKQLMGTFQMKEISRETDFKKTQHVRMQEMYAGHRVWGADAVIHTPNGSQGNGMLAANSTMNGKVFTNIKADVDATSPAALTPEQGQKALQQGINLYSQQSSLANAAVKDKSSELIIFVDAKNTAHWAYLVKFYVDPANVDEMPAKPVFIMDAETFKVYQQWNDVKTAMNETMGGGFGGNRKMGEVTYDDLAGDLPRLHITRDDDTGLCFLQNKEVTVKSSRTRKVINFDCANVVKEHNNVYWDGDLDAVNGGFSPGNDALFGGAVIHDMYVDWYGIPPLTENGKPMMLNMVVHLQMDNAYWDGQKMAFGDGISMFYPLTSLGVASHEISHGFTEQHSGLNYYSMSGGMNEAFSDMAAQAAEFYAYGKNSWQIGPEIFKAENEALRYMDKPSRDCNGDTPGHYCSIDDMSQWTPGLDVHYSSGIFNRAFYLMGTAKGWNTKKAFDVMVFANRYYWTSNSDFTQGACGVIKATKELGYDVAAVKSAFQTVLVDTKQC